MSDGRFKIGWCLMFLCLAAFFAPQGLRAESTNRLVWHRNSQTVDADISSWDVLQVMQDVSVATGWKVFLDPEAIHPVSAKFSGLPVGEALHAMLGNLNFVVVPQSNAPSQLYVYRSARQQATQLVMPVRKKAEPIPNQLVVVLKPGSKTKIEDLARQLNAKIIGRMDAQNTYLLQFDDPAATQLAREQLAANPDVAAVDNNYPIDPPPVVAGSASSTPDLKLNPATNSNCQLVVGLIDTPVQSLGTNMDAFVKPQIRVAGDAAIPTDQITHGTAMAQTILDSIATKTGGSTSVRILPVDVYGSGESTSTFNVANGIVQAVNNGANIINLSLGGTGDSTVLQGVIDQVVKQGIPVYAAAGNSPVTTPTYPAAYPGVIAVTATDNTGQIASYANRGSFIDIAAPGDNVVGFNGQNYMVEGTSTATAFVSGAAAGLADANHDCASQAQTLLQQNLPKSSILKTTP
jgi:hypothetical protein